MQKTLRGSLHPKHAGDRVATAPVARQFAAARWAGHLMGACEYAQLLVALRELCFLSRDDIGAAGLNGTHVPVVGNGDAKPVAGNSSGSHQVRPPKSTVAQRARRPVQASRSTAACRS